jgi:tellurium resistance protein TerD
MEECERIEVDLAAMPSSVAKLVFVVSIYDADEKRQHFGMIGDAKVGVYDISIPGKISPLRRIELARPEYSGVAGMILGEMQISGSPPGWEFNSVRRLIRNAGSLKDIVSLYEFDNLRENLDEGGRL